MSVHTLRRCFQVLVLLLVINAGLGYALGWMSFGVERFCPFGGIETLWAVATKQSFTCAMGPLNLSLMLALLALTLVARKAFCSWICPVGTVHEWLGMLGRRFRRWRKDSSAKRRLGIIAPSSRADAPWRWLRLPVLVFILFFTIGTSELIFRPYDPYYVLFSAHGHDVQVWSYAVIGALLLGGILLPMAWCRYLCPLGGALWPFSRFALLRLRRDESRCTMCRKCDAACPHGIAVSELASIDAGECTLCMECTRVCASQEALHVNAAGLSRRPVPAWVTALLLVVASAAGYLSADAFAFPSYERSYTDSPIPDEHLRTVTMKVKGVKCVDTAAMAARQLEDAPGVIALVAYAADRRLEISIDARVVDAEALVARIEAPVWEPSAEEFYFNVFEVREIRESNTP